MTATATPAASRGDTVHLDERTYKKVELLVYKTAALYWRRHGGDLDELTAEGNLAFCQAVRTYDPARGKFSTWLVEKIHHHYLRLYEKSKTTIKTVGLAFDPSRPGHKSTKRVDWEDYLSKLSGDAREYVAACIDSPPAVIRALHRKGLPTPCRVRKVVRKYLRLCRGWGKKRVHKAFHEARAKLLVRSDP